MNRWLFIPFTVLVLSIGCVRSGSDAKENVYDVKGNAPPFCRKLSKS